MPILKIKSKNIKLNKPAIIYLIISSSISFIDKLPGANIVIFLTNYHKFSIIKSAFIFAVSCFSVALFDFPLGNLADKYGRKKILILGIFLWCGGLFFYGIINKYYFILLTFIIQGIGFAFITGIPSSWYYDEIKNKKSENPLKVFSYSKIISNFLILLMGPILYILIKISYRLPFLICGLSGILLILFCYFNMKENYGIKNKISSYLLFKNNVKYIIQNKNFILYLVGDFFENIYFFGFIFIWQQIYLLSGFSKNYIGYVYSVMIFINGAGAFVISKIKRKHLNILYSYLISNIVVIIGFSFTLSFLLFKYIMLLGFLLIEFGLGLILTTNTYLVHNIIKKETRTAFISAISSFSGFITGIIYIINAIFLTKTNYHFLIIILIISIFIAGLIKIYLIKKIELK